MAKNWDYSEDKTRIKIDPPSRTKKITGHRLGAILGLDPYKTPFMAWCEICKIAEPPFEDNKYTIFGKETEHKIIEYVAERFPNVMSIEDYYGNIFNEYRYDNFKEDSKIMGGVMDAVSVGNDGKTIKMICECKSSSHPESWANGAIPTQYSTQGALYSYLKGLDKVLFACTFPKEIDYAKPSDYKVTDENTILRVVKLDDLIFEVDGQYLNINDCIKYAEEWWHTYVDTGISPEFDEVKDKDYLDIIRASDMAKDTNLEVVCNKAIELARSIDDLKNTNKITDMEKELKSLETSIKNKMIENDIQNCGSYKLTKKVETKFDKDLFAKNQPKLYELYCEEVESYTLTKNKKKDEED